MSRILLGISGSIAAYKTPELVRTLKKQGHSVTVVASKHALHFVSKIALACVSENDVYTDLFDAKQPNIHLDLIRSHDQLIIAPASANTIAKCANGIADSLLTTLFLCDKKPVMFAPAMHTEMWENTQTQKNIQTLKATGHLIIGPATGELACNDTGIGRMVDLNILENILSSPFTVETNLSEKSILITAGGTTEDIDSVRTLSNKSTGTLGHRLALLASLAGANVTLLSTNKQTSLNELINVIHTPSVKDMQQALAEQAPLHSHLIMAAAVSDFTVEKSKEKLSRTNTSSLELKQTPDLLKETISKNKHLFSIGFCLADSDLEKTAKEKLKNKGCNIIIANTSQSIGANQRSASILDKTGIKKELKDVSVNALANEILGLL